MAAWTDSSFTIWLTISRFDLNARGPNRSKSRNSLATVLWSFFNSVMASMVVRHAPSSAQLIPPDDLVARRAVQPLAQMALHNRDLVGRPRGLAHRTGDRPRTAPLLRSSDREMALEPAGFGGLTEARSRVDHRGRDLVEPRDGQRQRRAEPAQRRAEGHGRAGALEGRAHERVIERGHIGLVDPPKEAQRHMPLLLGGPSHVAATVRDGTQHLDHVGRRPHRDEQPGHYGRSRKRSRKKLSAEIVENSRMRWRSPGKRSATDSTDSPRASPTKTVPTGWPSCSAGPATPVTAKPMSASSTRRAPTAIASAAEALTTGPSGTPSTSNFTDESYETIEPLKNPLAPATFVMRAPIIPPVSDSASPSVSPSASSASATACSIVSSSTPNTRSPSTARSSASSAASTSRAVGSSGAFTVMRTFSPSTPLARKASVHVPASSRCSMRSARRSASPDSLSPHVRNVRLMITADVPERRRRSGSTAAVMIS